MKPLRKDEIEALSTMQAGTVLDTSTINLFGRLLDEVGRARSLLKRIEWAGYVDGYESGCPACSAVENRPREHSPGCELAALLGESR